MRTMAIRVLLAIGVASVAAGSSSDPTPTPSSPGIRISFDFQAAEAVLDALSGITAADVHALARLPGNARVIEHQHLFDPTATAERFEETLKMACRGGKSDSDTFQWGRVTGRLAATRALLARIRAHPEELSGEIQARLARYTPRDLAIRVQVFFVVGGTSDGFSDGDVFCIALDYFRDDYAGLRTLMAHELFHVAYDAIPRPGTPAAPEEVARALTLMEHTMNEGIASRVGDPMAVTDGKAWIEWFQGKFQKNFERMGPNFALFDTILYREFYDPDAPVETLYQIGFTGSYDSALYFVGYEMARVLEETDGPEAVARALPQPPLRFFERYDAIARGPGRVTFRFGASTREILRRCAVAAAAR